jgi:hypothetical protein
MVGNVAGVWSELETISTVQSGWAGTRRMASTALLRCPVDGFHDEEDC